MKLYQIIVTALLVLSCSHDRFEEHIDTSSADLPSIKGKVVNMYGEPVEHIKITLKWSNSTSGSEVVYTSSEGTFYSESDSSEWQDILTLEVSLEDIDGIDFGGLYESKNDVIKIYASEISMNEKINIERIYHLSHAIVSASSLQF